MAQSKTFSLKIIFVCLFCLVASGALAASPKKFPPISGEIYGQAVPGVKSISVNDVPVALDPDLNFRAAVNLKAGEKYLSLKIDYGAFQIVKKYLILRAPQVKKFKVHVPKEKIQRIAAPAEKISVTPRKRKRGYFKTRKVVLLRKVKKPQLKPRTYEYLYVWEFDRGKLLIVKASRGRYSAEIYLPATGEWFDFKKLSRSELKML